MNTTRGRVLDIVAPLLLTLCLPLIAAGQTRQTLSANVANPDTTLCTGSLDTKMATQIDEYMKAAAGLGRFGGSLLVAKQGKVVISNGYGFANLEHEILNTPQTKFRIASITKQFTAMAVLILQERGLLKVQDPVCKYLTDCPEAWQQITIHHLLTMTSGIPNFENFPDNEKYERLPTTVEATIERFKGKPLEFAPGERFSYSSSGYVLLGHVIERVSGLRYEDFLRKQIFDPSGMRNSGYDHPQTVLMGRAAGFAKQGTKFVNAVHYEMDTPHAAGALYSTVEDLFLWDQALYTEKLVSKNSLESMFTPFKGPYAYGWVVTELQGRKVITHGGTISGFRSWIIRYPEERACVILLSNFEVANLGTPAQDIASIILGKDYKVPKVPNAIGLDPKTVGQYVGRYRSNRKREIIITKEDDRLMYYPWAGSRSYFELHAETDSKFFVKEIEFSFTVFKGEDGHVAYLLTHEGEKLEKVE